LITVIDASFVISVLLQEIPARLDEDLAVLTRTKCVSSAFLKLELRHSLIVSERRNRLSKFERVFALETFIGMPIEFFPFPTDAQLESCESLATGNQLSLYDSVYLEIAMRHGGTLATLDRNLRRAAEQQNIRSYPEFY
jgi:predicted nucleic acid-binding protein